MSLRVESEAVGTLRELLTSDERDRARCFRFDRDRDAFVVTRGALRRILSRYLNRQPEAIAFRYGTYGKPELAMDSDLQFNVTHAGDIALIAVARGRQLGIDVEPVRVLPDADAIVERFFSANEVAVYRSLPASARPKAFFTCWTRKEAFIKALGDGLTHPLDAFDVTVRPDEPAKLLRVRGVAEPPPWHVEALPIDLGYAATVAVEGSPCAVTCWDAGELVDTPASPMLALV
ncbi:MAG: 4'-phosphopantetheinyl transferase superfamily protein [Rubricoccaceae bacterium]